MMIEVYCCFGNLKDIPKDIFLTVKVDKSHVFKYPFLVKEENLKKSYKEYYSVLGKHLKEGVK